MTYGTLTMPLWLADSQDYPQAVRSVGPNISSIQYLCEYCIRFTDAADFRSGTGSILLDDVQCTGNESSLFQCPHNGIGNHACSTSDVAGVRCLSGKRHHHMSAKVQSLSFAERECNDTEIRLVGGSSPGEGAVQFCYYGFWGNICNNRWGINDVMVVCRELGLPTGCKFIDLNQDSSSVSF